jgi:hypothetical protein
MSSLDSDQSGGLSSSELQSFVDGLDDKTRSSLLSLQEDSSSSSSSTSSSSTSSTDGSSSSDLVSQLMSSLDQDGDGSVSEDELKGFMEANAPPPPPPPPGGPNGADGASADATSSDTSSSSTTSTSASASTSSSSSSLTSSSSDTDTSKYSQMLAQMLMQSYGQASGNMMPPPPSFDAAA